MKFTSMFRYGLRALSVIAARHGQGPVSARRIAELEDLSPAFLEQLLARLRRGGVVVGVRGPGGGFRLARSPDQIGVDQIARALEGPLCVAKCVCPDGSESDECDRIDRCAAQPLLRKLGDDITGVLGSYTLADVACDMNDPGAGPERGKAGR